MKSNPGAKKILKILAYGLYLVIILILALEIILRIYNPFPARIKGDNVILPANQTIVYKNDKIPSLEKNIVINYNSLGFAGPEMPADYDSCLSIITVGGSTTACWNISTDKTWPSLLSKELSGSFKKVWLNNAGVSGQSSYGHWFMLRDHVLKLKPKVIIFLTGVNDIDRTDIDEVNANSTKNFRQFLLKYSETYNLILMIVRNSRAFKHGLVGAYADLGNKKYDTLSFSSSEIKERLEQQASLVEAYKERMQRLIDTCLDSNVLPILLTQPVLYGDVIDSLSGVNLGTIKPRPGMNGALYHRKVEAYNDVLRYLAQDYNIPCIDLANMLPKSSRYYFDFMHYTNEGAAKVSELITPHISKYLSDKFPEYKK